MNSTKHGMAGQSAAVEPGLSAEFEARRARWAAEQQPVGEAGEWALDRAVAASLRIETCERAMEELTAASRERARLAWDQDRAVEAATTFGRLARDPVLASRQLQGTLAGVEMLVEAWLGLAAPLVAGEDWSESEASRALDLLGVAADLRSGRTLVDEPEGSDPLAYRRELVREEIDRLEALREEALAPLDAMEHRLAMDGDAALLSRPARLLLRYERDAWRRFRESMSQVQAPPPVVAAPAPVVEARPEARERAVAHPSPTPEGASPSVKPEARGRSLPFAESAPAHGSRIDPGATRPLVTERTQFAGLPVAPSLSGTAGR